MNAMGHDVPTMIGVDHRGVAQQITQLIPDYMVMGERGMADMAEMEMPLPDNTAPMMTGDRARSARSRWAACSASSRCASDQKRRRLQRPRLVHSTRRARWPTSGPARWPTRRASRPKAAGVDAAAGQAAPATSRSRCASLPAATATEPLTTFRPPQQSTVTPMQTQQDEHLLVGAARWPLPRRGGALRARRQKRTPPRRARSRRSRRPGASPAMPSAPSARIEVAHGRHHALHARAHRRYGRARPSASSSATTARCCTSSSSAPRQRTTKHAALMLKFPDMEHDEPYMAHVPPGKTGEIVWTFNRAGRVRVRLPDRRPLPGRHGRHDHRRSRRARHEAPARAGFLAQRWRHCLPSRGAAGAGASRCSSRSGRTRTAAAARTG